MIHTESSEKIVFVGAGKEYKEFVTLLLTT